MELTLTNRSCSFLKEGDGARRGVSAWMAMVFFILVLLGCAGNSEAVKEGSEAGCDQAVPPIITGYGAEGAYAVELHSLPNPSFRRSPVMVFIPKGAEGKRPVVFFSHGYGPNHWESYADLINHIVSRGYILIYSTYPAVFADNDERYHALWSGFESAAARFGSQMDLSKVGFLGHSFGGGATPAMAYHGLVEKGWGAKGAFMMEMAPWYEFQITPPQWQQLPSHVLHLVQVYEKDDTNDHRMAIDMYNSSAAARKYFMMVHSARVDHCNLVADHSTPGRSQFIRQKQYGVFRPFDALADCAFTNSACGTLEAIGHESSGGYQPVTVEVNPVPSEPESFYKFAWSNKGNPRLHQ